MKQELSLGHKPQTLILCSLEHSTLCNVVPSHLGAQSEKGDSVVFDTAPLKYAQGDSGCPDGGLRAWLVVFGVCLTLKMSLWTVTHITLLE
jgi:hypothetical protein